MKNIVSQFIPIILLYLFLTLSKDFVIFSHSLLGKVLAILIIIYYTILDKRVGLLICSIVILYYQSDYIENFLNIDNVMPDLFNNKEGMQNKNEETESFNCTSCKSSNLNVENMCNINEVYNSKQKVERSMEEMQNQNGYLEEFRKQYCDDNQLKYKNMNVKTEMVEHVFPEIEFEHKECNPCSDKCKFSVIENRIKAENNIKPINSKE